MNQILDLGTTVSFVNVWMQNAILIYGSTPILTSKNINLVLSNILIMNQAYLNMSDDNGISLAYYTNLENITVFNCIYIYIKNGN